MNQKLIVMALVLMVAIPILLGYGLAFEDHDHEGWDSGDSEDITDLMALQQVNYYVQDTSPNNNGSIMYNYIITEGGHTYDYNDIASVSWNQVYSSGYLNTANYSSQPVYTYTNDIVEFPISSYTVNAANGILNQSNWPAGLNNASIRIEGSQLETLTFTSAGSSWTSDIFYGSPTDHNTIKDLFDNQTPSDNRYRDFSFSNVWMQPARYLDVTDFQISGPANMTYKIYVMGMQPFNAGTLYPNLDGEMAFRLERGDILAYRVYDDQGNTYPTLYTIQNFYDTPMLFSQVLQSDGTIDLFTSDTTLYEDNRTNIAQIGITKATPTDELVYLKEFHNYFADVAKGWKQSNYYAGSEFENVEGVWYNGHINQKVCMAVYVPRGESVRIYPDTSSSGIYLSTDASGVTSIGSTPLGNYGGRIWIEFDCVAHEVRFSGIIMPNGSGALPEYGRTPQISNTVTVSRPLMNSISHIGFMETNVGRITYRVDLTYTDTGHYWGIHNYTLNPEQYWPSKSVSFKLTSIQAYGDYIYFGGSLFNITDGKIDLNGKATPLRNAIFMCAYSQDEGRWYNTINGQTLSTDTGSSASSIQFHGDWLMKVNKYELTRTTWTSHEWQPGVFAFNGADNSFALLGLAGSAAVFIALALYGRHSGAKVGSLMLVCGFAGLIFLCMIV